MASSKELERQSGLYGAVGEFDDETDLLDAIEKIRHKGYSKLEAYTPFPVHGIDEALGNPPSKLGWLVLCCGATGVTAAATFIWWAGAIDYPIIVGGKPLFAFTFSIPIMFEMMILSSAFASLFGMLGINRLPQFYHPIFNYKNSDRINDDGFVLAIEAADPKFDAEECVKVLESAGAKYAEVVPK
jgi:Protein of unknown function (DUF3341)